MIATTVHRSRELLRAGLSPKTADMYHQLCLDPHDPRKDTYVLVAVPYSHLEIKGEMSSEKPEVLPAWSLTALLEILPTTICGRPDDEFVDFRLEFSKFRAGVRGDKDWYTIRYVREDKFRKLDVLVSEQAAYPEVAAARLVTYCLECGWIEEGGKK